MSRFNSFSLRQVGIGGLIGGNKHNTSLNLINKEQHNREVHNRPSEFYDLKAAIVHYGTAQSGHFITYRKPLRKQLSNDSTWLQVSDSDVKTCKEFNLLESNVYMLFYDRVCRN